MGLSGGAVVGLGLVLPVALALGGFMRCHPGWRHLALIQGFSGFPESEKHGNSAHIPCAWFTTGDGCSESFGVGACAPTPKLRLIQLCIY